MSLPKEGDQRKSARGNDVEPSLHELLTGLGFCARERVSINTQLPGERFVSSLREVGSLAGWSPPHDRNVWFGVNPVGRQVRYGRGTEADIARVRTLFADFDIKPGQFRIMQQCYEATLNLEGELGIAPVAAIESGHGLQPLWRLGSPPGDSNVVDRDRSRDEWKSIYQRWGNLVQFAARAGIWSPWATMSFAMADPDKTENPEAAHALCDVTIDNVFDLSRVLRCPGSVNWKDPDSPVPVCTRLFDHRDCIRPRDLVRGLDRDNISPLAVVRQLATRVATDLGEADVWITEQSGATLEPAELALLPRSAVLHEYLDPAKLVEVLADQRGAHETMRGKVLHAVLSAQEGRAGLAVALNNLGDAYLEVMGARSRGDLAGEARSASIAADDWRRAVVGAVAKARGRVLPNVDGWGPVMEIDQ
jgi:hypothetical protein